MHIEVLAHVSTSRHLYLMLAKDWTPLIEAKGSQCVLAHCENKFILFQGPPQLSERHQLKKV